MAQSPVVEQVAFRLDFPSWLASLSERDQRIVRMMLLGHTTTWLSRRFQLSAGRISQLRRQLMEDWRRFTEN